MNDPSLFPASPLLLAAIVSAALGAEPRFALTGPNSIAYGATNGIVVGGIALPGRDAGSGFQYSFETGRIDYPDRGGLLGSVARAITADGSVVYGDGRNIPQSLDYAPFRRVGNGPLEFFDAPPQFDTVEVTGTSGDGRYVIGTSGIGTQTRLGGAFLWSEQTGSRDLLVQGREAYSANAHGISGNGTLIVGYSMLSEIGPDSVLLATCWNTAGESWTLPNHPDSPVESRTAFGVSFDGRTIVGDVTSPSGATRAVRWVDGGLPELLGSVPGLGNSFGRDASANGEVIVGRAFGGLGEDAFVWTGATGMLSMRSYLERSGVTVPTGYSFLDCHAVSEDGQTFAGYGRIDGVVQGFFAQVPAPSTIVLVCVGCVMLGRGRRVR